MFSCLNLVVEISSHFVFVCSLQKPIGSHWFEKVLLELFSLSFFINWWNSTQPFFSAWISCTSKIQKYNRNFFDLLKRTSMDFFRLFVFWQESHWILYLFFYKNYIHIIYQYCIATSFPCRFLEEFHLVLFISHHLKT